MVDRLRRRRSEPIVLMHGFLGFNRIGPLAYFHNVAEYLWLHGFPTYAPTADPLNTFGYRAYEWFYGHEPRDKDIHITEHDRDYRPRSNWDRYRPGPFMLRRLRVQGIGEIYLRHRRPVHLIAHSQAAIGARFLTSPDGMGNWLPFADGTSGDDVAHLTIADCIASVTTVAGPHNGVLIADDTEAVTQFMHDYVFPSVNWFISLLSHDESDLWSAAREFGVEYMMDSFNPKYSDHPDISYNSIAGVTNEYQVNLILRYFYHQTRHSPKYEQSDNDGFVPLGSAKWPIAGSEHRQQNVIAPPLLRDHRAIPPMGSHDSWNFLGIIYADHINQIGMPLSYPRNVIFKHLPFYLGIARRVTGDHADDVRLHPDGRWRVPSELEMLPSLRLPNRSARSDA